MPKLARPLQGHSLRKCSRQKLRAMFNIRCGAGGTVLALLAVPSFWSVQGEEAESCVHVWIKTGVNPWQNGCQKPSSFIEAQTADTVRVCSTFQAALLLPVEPITLTYVGCRNPHPKRCWAQGLSVRLHRLQAHLKTSIFWHEQLQQYWTGYALQVEVY